MASQWLSGLANASTDTSKSGRYARTSHETFNQENVEENRTPPSMRRAANRRAMPAVDASPDRSTNSFRSGNERLYEAYNDLHTLAQDFEKPFDAPAILVVGHQTDGKSGLQLTILFCCYLQLLTLTAVASGTCTNPNGTHQWYSQTTEWHHRCLTFSRLTGWSANVVNICRSTCALAPPETLLWRMQQAFATLKTTTSEQCVHLEMIKQIIYKKASHHELGARSAHPWLEEV